MRIRYSKALTVIVIFVCLLYFIVGGIAVWIGWFSKDDYLTFGGVVGGLASVIGLISLAKPAITSDDLGQVELSTLEKLTRASKEIESLEAAKQKTKEEVSSLELQRQELEVLVRKASLVLFLKEQVSYHEKNILESVSRDATLKESLEQVVEVRSKLQKLEEEIALDPNVDVLRQVIEDAGASDGGLEAIARDAPPFVRLFLQVAELLSKSIVRIIKP